MSQTLSLYQILFKAVQYEKRQYSFYSQKYLFYSNALRLCQNLTLIGT